MTTFYREDDYRDSKVNYEKYEGVLGSTFVNLPPQEERQQVDSWYRGQQLEWEPLLRSRPIDERLYDLENWIVGSVSGPAFFSDVFVRNNILHYRQFNLWSLLVQQRRPDKVSAKIEKKEVEVVSFSYYFTTVEASSVVLVSSGGGERAVVAGLTYSFRYELNASGVRLPCPSELRDFLYEREVKKSQRYIETYGRHEAFDDWLYSLAMYDKHKEDHLRVLSLLGPETHVLSYGDRVGQLRPLNRTVSYMDRSPSSFALASVARSDNVLLRMAAAKETNAILLLYTWYGLTTDQKNILMRAKARVIIWGESDDQIMTYGTGGVSSNMPLLMSVCPTERKIRRELPWTINFSSHSGHVFLDSGVMMDYLVQTCLVTKIRMLNPSISSYRGIPVEKGKAEDGEVYVAHSYSTLKYHFQLSPYFVPTGRRHDRLFPVSADQQSYNARVLYQFQGPRPFRATVSESFTVVEKDPHVVGYFLEAMVAPGLCVLAVDQAVENCHVVVEKTFTRVDLNGKTHFVKNKKAKDQIELLAAGLSAPECYSLWVILKYQVRAPSFLLHLEKWLRTHRSVPYL